MSDRRPIYFQILTCLFAILFAFLISGCSLLKGNMFQGKKLAGRIEKIVVLGFRPALTQPKKPGMIRSPFSGAVFMAETVSENIADNMTSNLFERIRKYKGYELIGPNQARGVFASLVSSDQGMSDIEIVKKIGQSFSADAVMVGYIYRWREREGTDYSVNRPASVAFDLYLIGHGDKTVLWGGKFDKTQKSLSENILDLRTFLKGKGKWMTATGLAELGLTELLQELPLKEK